MTTVEYDLDLTGGLMDVSAIEHLADNWNCLSGC